MMPANANKFTGVVLDSPESILKSPSSGALNQASVPVATRDPKATEMTGLDRIDAGDLGAGRPVHVVIFLDFQCPHCAEFEKNYAQELRSLVGPKLELEYRPIAILDQASNKNYSTRSLAASACVLNSSPEKYLSFFDSLFAKQPSETASGLDDSDLAKLANEAGAGDISSCLADRKYEPFALFSTQIAYAYNLQGNPTMLVDGKPWKAGSPVEMVKSAIAAKGL